MKISRIKSFWYRLARLCCRVFCSVCFRMRVFGRENIPRKGGFILACNHQSYLDPVFCGIQVNRNLNYLARSTLFSNPFFGRLIKSVNTIPVKRAQADLSAIKKVIACLKQGHGVCLYPEATRTRDGRIAEFRPGFGLLCRRSDVPVIPVAIEGAFECWPRGKKIFSFGCEIAVFFGWPIKNADVKKLSNEELAKEITTKVRAMQNDLRAKSKKEPIQY